MTSQESPKPADASQYVLGLFHDASENVPAYRAFLREHGVAPDTVRTPDDFAQLPLVTKQNYHQIYPLAQLCRGGRLERADMLAVSSGSTGTPTVWPRRLMDEAGSAARFEQVLVGAFRADVKSTLVVVCFALGSWVGGMYTTSVCRQLATRGYPITTVTPGNNASEILRIVRAMEGQFEQLVLAGYPPFLRDVIDAGAAAGIDWPSHRARLLMAGEVFSEAWRDLICRRLGDEAPELVTAALYGTADGGALANETPVSIRVRRALSERPELAREVFGEPRLPTLCQFDPTHRYFEALDGQLVFSGDGFVPLLRYNILDRGGVLKFDELLATLARHGVQVRVDASAPRSPFVYVFGRSSFAVSYYGANVYPENVAVGIEQPNVASALTGKFVLEVAHDEQLKAYLKITVELAAGASGSEPLRQAVTLSVHEALLRVNSEYANYVPPEAQRPRVTLLSNGDSAYFPTGVKHRYTRH